MGTIEQFELTPIQSSLRDCRRGFHGLCPSDESLGYYQMPLRGKLAATNREDVCNNEGLRPWLLASAAPWLVDATSNEQTPYSYFNGIASKPVLFAATVDILLQISQGDVCNGEFLAEGADKVPKMRLNSVQSRLFQASVPMSL